MKFLSYGSQSIDTTDILAVTKALKSEYLTQGPLVSVFEQALSRCTGARYTVAVNSGTAALHTAYAALGLTKGDEIITSPMTFAATTNAALYLGAKPVFVDIHPETGCINPALIEAKITKRTKLITVIDYGGQPVEFDNIAQIAKKHKLKIVDDACHALGARYKGHRLGSGSLADATILSFHPVKHITTGEGGAIQIKDRAVYETAIKFRTHGITKDHKQFKTKSPGDWYYEMQDLGFNYRITDIQAALGVSQLRRVEAFLEKRRSIASLYDKAFAGNPYFDTPPTIAHTEHAYHLYPIRLKDSMVPFKSQLVKALHAQSIGTQVHYIPVYFHPYYQNLGYKMGSCPNAEMFYKRVLSIPMSSNLQSSDVKRVIRTLLKTCKELSENHTL